MNKNAKILVVSNFIFLLLLFSNFSSSLGAIPSWHAGDVIDFGQTSLLRVTYYEGNATSYQIMETNTDFKVNITAVDILNKEYRASIIQPLSVSSILTYDFNYEILTDSFLNIANIFDVDYVWDFEHNTTVLKDFSLGASYVLLLEPEWDEINKIMKNSLNESTIIDTVDDPFQPITYNFTLGYFLNNITSYKIMDKTDLVKAKEEFRPTATKWSLEFDLSGIIHYATYNSTLGYDLFKPIDKYLITYELEYDKGGILNYYQKTIDTSTDYEILPQDLLLDDKIILGGLKAFTSNFALITIFPAFLFISIFVVRKRRKNTR
ncbi:MAG: hypothetical protein ACFFDW_13405 [Candidatus Thorarchaeota archaeon]